LAVTQYQSFQFQPALVISNLKGVGILNAGRITLQDVCVSLPSSDITVNGSLVNLQNPEFDLEFSANPITTGDFYTFLDEAVPDTSVIINGSIAGGLSRTTGVLSGQLDSSRVELAFEGALVPLDLHLTVVAQLGRLSSSPILSNDISVEVDGQIVADTHIDTTGLRNLRARAQLENIKWGRLLQKEASFDVAFDDGNVSWHMTSSGTLGHIDLEGQYHVWSERGAVNGTFENLNLGMLPKQPYEIGKATGTVSVVVDTVWQASVGLKEITYDSHFIQDLKTDFVYGGGRVDIRHFEAFLTGLETRLVGTGQVFLGDEQQRVVGQVKSFIDLQRVMPDTGYGEYLEFGTDFDLRIGEGVWGDVSTVGEWGNFGVGIDSLRLESLFDGQPSVHVDASAWGPVGRLQALGRVGYDGALDLGFSVNLIKASLVGELLGQEIVSDPFLLSGQLGGTVEAPLVQGDVEIPEIVIGDVPMQDLELSVKWVFPTSGSVALRLGAVSWGERTLKGVFFDATHNETKTDFLFGSNPEQEDRVYLWGYVENLERSVHVVVDSMHVQASEVALYNRGPLKVTYDRDRGFHIERFELAGPAGRILGRDHSDFKSTIEVLLTDIDLRPWAFLFGQPQITGRLDAELAFSGELSDPLVFAEGGINTLGFYGLEIPTVTTNFSYGEKRVLVDVEVIPQQGKQISLTGSVPIEPNESLQLDLNTRGFAIAQLDTFLSGTHALDGDLDLSLTLGGTLNAPTYVGSAKWVNGKIDHPSIGRVYEPIVATVRVDQGKVSIDSLFIGRAGQQLVLSGSTDLTGGNLSAFDINMDFVRFQPVHLPDVQAELNGHLQLHGSPSKPRLVGDLIVQHADIRLGELMATPSTGWEQWPFVQALQMAMRVRAGQQVWVRDPTFNIETTGDLDLVKDAEGFKAFGSMQSKRGNYVFQNRRLDIAHADILFQGRPDIDPDLDIEAQTRVMARLQGDDDGSPDPVIVIVSVGGTLFKPEITLSSNPVVGDGQFDDVLSVLLIGATREKMVVGNASDFVLGTLANRFGQRVGEGLRLDLVEVDVSESNISRVRVGKYLTPRLFVSYAQDMISTGKEVAVEFKLMPSLTIEAKQIDVGQEETLIKQTRESVGVVWEKEW
ncbi:MAG: translocation/assembly module TamB, partial [Candidatus Latescibacteria bacterium]|nr:translocation/assembly module TamB [Candidatus Latescibacterota bacterium]